MQILVFIFGLVLFIGLVLVHEWGHFIMARRNGVDVEEFGLGFPPGVWSRKLKSGMRLSLNALPLGGFVKLKGEHDYDNRKGSLGASSLGAKSKILLAGVTMNLLVGLLFLTVLAWIGMPKLLTQDNVGQDQFTVSSDTKIAKQAVLTGAIEPSSPAASSGIRSTDQLLSIGNGAKTLQLKTTQQLHDATIKFAGQNTELSVRRTNTLLTKTVKLRSISTIAADIKRSAGLKSTDKIVSIKDQNLGKTPVAITSDAQLYSLAQQTATDSIIKYERAGVVATKVGTLQPEGYLGIEPNQLQIQRSTWSAPIVAAGLTKQIFVLTFKGLGHALAGLGSTIAGGVTRNHQARENGQDQASSQVGGPVAIGVALWDYGSLGFNFMLFLIALISLTLALMNILPIPALDGGRLAMILISRGVFRRPLSRLVEERVVGASFALLLALIALITIVDVKRFF
jgi:regulator of sigma E protease